MSKPQSTQAGGSYHVNSDGSEITGITYLVYAEDLSVLAECKQVTDDDSYDIVSNNRGTDVTTTYTGRDALFENETYAYYLLSDEEGEEMASVMGYKDLSVGEDGSFTFGPVTGAAVTELTEPTAEISTGSWHSEYGIEVTDPSETLTSSNTAYAVVLATESGESFGLRHIVNMWRVLELGFDLADYPNLEGQTITEIKYYTDAGIYTIAKELVVEPLTEENETGYLHGDINGDGTVDISDVQLLLKYVNRQDVEVVREACDVNGDGIVNITDVQLLLKFVNGQDVTI